jgi:hypothetical protein
MKPAGLGSSLIALGAFMAILVILSPALSYAQQSDADFIQSLDGARFWLPTHTGLLVCFLVDGRSLRFLREDPNFGTERKTFPIEGRGFHEEARGDGSAVVGRITSEAIMREWTERGRDNTEVFVRDRENHCGGHTF